MLSETPTHSRRLARLAGVALAALAGALLTPRFADAGCGPRRMLPAGPHGAHAATPDAHRPQLPAPERPAPCRGPHCSRAPDRAPPAPAPTAPAHGDLHACLSPRPAVPGGGDGAHLREPSALAPAGHLPRVERPPRP